MKYYVVTMYRWGDREKHSYVIGVFDDLQKATDAGIFEETYRGKKYQFNIKEFELNKQCRKYPEDLFDPFREFKKPI